jgi:hypothetical protein
VFRAKVINPRFAERAAILDELQEVTTQSVRSRKEERALRLLVSNFETSVHSMRKELNRNGNS